MSYPDPNQLGLVPPAPKPPKKPSWWSKAVQAIGNAIGNAKFGQ